MMDMIMPFFSSSKKIGISSSKLGPYTLVTQKIAPLFSESNFVDMEWVLDMEDKIFMLEKFQAVRIPQDALNASTVIKCPSFSNFFKKMTGSKHDRPLFSVNTMN
jgi:hypothetical protein